MTLISLWLAANWRKNACLKKWHEKKWLALEKLLRSLRSSGQTPKQFQNFFWPKNYFRDRFSQNSIDAHWPKNGSKDGLVFTLFDPLCPEGCVLGPMGWVIWSTPGGQPNHPPRPLVGLTITVLGPQRSSHGKTGWFFRSWIIGRGPHIWGRVTLGGNFICMYNISGQ